MNNKMCIFLILLTVIIFVISCSLLVFKPDKTDDKSTELDVTSTVASTDITETTTEPKTETTTLYEKTEWKTDADGNPYIDKISDDVWQELSAKTGKSPESLKRRNENIEISAAPPSWDKSEAPLTPEQEAEIAAEQASILAEIEAEKNTEAALSEKSEKNTESEIETTSVS